jgi:hypothetical protein
MGTHNGPRATLTFILTYNPPQVPNKTHLPFVGFFQPCARSAPHLTLPSLNIPPAAVPSSPPPPPDLVR